MILEKKRYSLDSLALINIKTRLNPNWQKGAYFYLLVLFGLYFVIWIYIKNVKTFWSQILTSIGLIWHESYKTCPKMKRWHKKVVLKLFLSREKILWCTIFLFVQDCTYWNEITSLQNHLVVWKINKKILAKKTHNPKNLLKVPKTEKKDRITSEPQKRLPSAEVCYYYAW